MGARRRSATVCAGVLVISCGSHEDLGSDPHWGQGFSTRLADAGNPDAPSSAAQACALFGGAPYAYPSIDDLQAKLSQRWVGCGDNPVEEAGFWPRGFTGIQFDPAGTWQALVREADGSVQLATVGNSAGKYQVVRYMDGSAQYAAAFIVYIAPNGSDLQLLLGEQWQGTMDESPAILDVVSAHTGDHFRFSSAPP